METIHDEVRIPEQAVPATALRARPVRPQRGALRQDDPAGAALTDFQHEAPIFVTPERPVGDALLDMVRLDIHALLVAGPGASAGRRLEGLLTYRRLEQHAVRSSRLAAPSAGASMQVADLMTPTEELALVHWDSLGELRVAHLNRMFQGTGLSHVLVVEHGAQERVLVRGIISRAAVARRSGLEPHAEHAARSGRRPADENLLIT